MSLDTSSHTATPTLRLPSGEIIGLDRPVTVGRAADNDVVLQHPSVSRYHCTITPQDGSLILVDRQSANGTIVNGGGRIAGPHALGHGDRIRVGDMELQVDWPPAPQPAAVPAATQVLSREPAQTVVIAAQPEPSASAPVEEELAPAPPPPAPPRTARLYLRRGPGAPRLIDWDRATPITIGRSEDSALVVPHESVSRHHAEIRDKDGMPVVADLGSANGTFLNGGQVSTWKLLEPGDSIVIGLLEVIYDPDPHAPATATLAALEAGKAGQEFPLGRDTTTIGRAPTSDIVFSDPSVSNNQARIERWFGDFWLHAVSDRQPVLLNNDPITAPALLRSGDTIGFGRVTLVFRQQETLTARAPARAAASLTLREVAPFKDQAEDAFNEILGAGAEVTFEPGAVIMEPEKGKIKKGALYVLLEGEAEVLGPIGGDWETTGVVARLTAGEYCGERVLTYDQPYPYRVKAVTRVRAFRLHHRDFAKLRTKRPALGGFFKDRVARRGLVKYLREVPLLGRLPQERLEALSARIKVKAFPAGDVVARNGEVARTFFLIAGGSFRASAVKEGQLQTLTSLTEGKYFGEQIAGPEETYPYSVVAETAGEAYTLTRDEFLALQQEFPDALNFGGAGLPPSVLLLRTPPFDTLPPELIADVARALRFKGFRAGETIIYQDDPSGSAFYIIVSGDVDVRFRARDGQERTLAKLGAGDSFGEAALLTGSPRNASVVATEDSQLLALYKREFDEIMAKAPAKFGTVLGHNFNSRYRPKHIDDFEVFEQQSGDKITYIIRHNTRNSYVSLSDEGYFIWNLLDGEHTMNDIGAAYYQQYKALRFGVMIGTVFQLQQLGFLDVTMEDLMRYQGIRLRLPLKIRILIAAASVLRVQKEFKHAHKYFEFAYRMGGKLVFLTPIVWLIAAINIGGLVAYAGMQITGYKVSHTNLVGGNALVLFAVNAVILYLHETGHGLTMIHIGRRVLGAGIGWMIVAPMAYVNTTDAWLATKRQRLAVTAGGMLVHSTAGALAALALLFVNNDALELVLVVTIYAGFFGFMYNCNPLFPTDGYNFLMDAMAIPDLRPRALHYLLHGRLFRDLLRRKMTGEQKAFAIFSLVVIGYLIFVVFNIVTAMVQQVAPKLQEKFPTPVALTLALVIPALFIGLLVLNVLKEGGVLGAKK